MPFLACVQSKLEPDAYRSTEAFSAWILEQTRQALEHRNPAEPALVAFPELIGLPLVFWLERSVNHPANRAGSVREAALALARDTWLEALRLGVQHRNLSPSSFLLPNALEVYTALKTAFANAARTTNSFIVAGSSFLPGVEDEAAKGLHLADGRVQNVSYLFAPSGLIVGRQGKINLTAGLEGQLGLSKARLEDLSVVHTPFARICTLICYDAFFERALERTDGLGADILVQPSANAARWDGPWSADANRIEGEEWLQRGPVTRIQGRVNLRYCLNPMLVGKLYDLEFEGRSSISVNPGLEPNGTLRLASSASEFETVAASVPNIEGMLHKA